MIYLIYGTDNQKARKKLHELTDLAQKKRPEAEIFKITIENWSEPQFDELLVAQGLFESKYTVVLDNLFEKKDCKSYIVDRLEEMKDSDQIFLILEGSIDVATLKKLEKNSKQTQEFVLKETKKENGSIFSITNGLIDKDRKKLWISYLDFISKGTSPEEIHGIFFWQVKNMILAGKSKSASETGLSPFVYRNAESGARKYKIEELIKMSGELVEMTHRVRTGKGDLDIMLEKWILGV